MSPSQKKLFIIIITLISLIACRNYEKIINELAVKCRDGDKKACRDLADIARSHSDYGICQTAVKKLGDQSMLFELAGNAGFSGVRMSAAQNLTDQQFLALIARGENYDKYVRKFAIEKLTSQAIIAEIAKDGKGNQIIREAAISRLEDVGILSELALADSPVSRAALYQVDRLCNRAKAAAEEGTPVSDDAVFKIHESLKNEKTVIKEVADSRYQVIKKFVQACKSVPEGTRHRLMGEILPVVRILQYPEIVSALGQIRAMTSRYYKTGRRYIGTLSGTMPGESFTFSIHLEKFDRPVSCTWATSFPSSATSLSFRKADIDAYKLLKKVLENINDQHIFLAIHKRDKTEAASMIVVEKITDQPVLADIARNARYKRVILAAIKKLSGNPYAQSVLAEIATNKKNWLDLRLAAVEKLTNQDVLLELTKKDQREDIRFAAAEKLTDRNIAQSVYIDLATAGKGIIHIIESAVKKITDREKLVSIIKKTKINEIREAAKERLKQLTGK